MARYLLAPLLVATVAMGTSLGNEAGRGARQPIEELLTHAAVSTDDVRVLLPYADALPFNDAEIAPDGLQTAPAGALPVRLVLGSASNPSQSVNPSSAALLAIPDGLWTALGFPDAEPGAVATTKQFARQGESVEVNGVTATVVSTLDWFPGLDRTAVLMRSSDPAFNTAAQTFSAILLIDDEAREWGAVNASALGLTDTNLTSWFDQYNHFWARSVSPLSMEYLLALLLVGAVASGFIRGSDILRRRRLLAVQHILGVTRRTLVVAELHRAAFDAASATLLGAPLYIVLVAVTNSSQYGVSIPLNTAGLGAGALLVGLSMVLSVTAAALMINRMDTANEVR